MTTLEALKIVVKLAEGNKEPKSIVGSNQVRADNENALRLVRALAEAVV